MRTPLRLGRVGLALRRRARERGLGFEATPRSRTSVGYGVEIAGEAARVVHLRHEANVGERQRVAEAVAAAAEAPTTNVSSGPNASATQCEYHLATAASSSFSSPRRYLSTRRLFSG